MAVTFYYHDKRLKPQRSHLNDSGWDVRAVEDISLAPGKSVMVGTGVKYELDPQNSKLELQVRPRSSQNKNEVWVGLGTCDYDYAGEVKVVIKNLKKINLLQKISNKLFKTKYGFVEYKAFEDRIAQFVIQEVEKTANYKKINQPDWKNFSKGGTRGTGGFGSTGK